MEVIFYDDMDNFAGHSLRCEMKLFQVKGLSLSFLKKRERVMMKKWSFEFYSWIFVFVLASLFLIPIYFKVGELYQFYFRNLISIIIFVTLTRYIFLLAFTPFSHVKWFKLFLIFIPIPLILFQIDSLFSFMRFLDEDGTASLFKSSVNMDDYDFGNYIKVQYLIFCIGALISLVALPVRMIISFWRTINTENRV